MTLQEFRDTFVKIEYLEDEKTYGHKPFHLHAEDGERPNLDTEVPPMDMNDFYRPIGLLYLAVPNSTIYFSVDFPAMEDMKNDFVAVFSVIDKKFSIVAIPYNPETGEVYEDVKLEDSVVLGKILDEFKHSCYE